LNRKIPIIVAAVAIITILIVFLTNIFVELDDIFMSKQHEAVWSGPLGVTQYEHRLGAKVSGVKN